ncbi:MarR family transcriptional regulator [Streptomyces sp. OF3]|uniref:MarR family transcriptional regulator n=2 Tax=Streptomyces alkaliterrae TaxID=2213162 RepID=A0A5P0YYP0_9ACTN|nr:MarR family transcriptional regulator [Streptomyces alkaliterrae]MBB1260686.1 MarR family transcriptional regulator [Streptomyces alkaliterrae]MQS03569.1 MarR family transcriptional regulator [Streptomyces alkaliterrae]
MPERPVPARASLDRLFELAEVLGAMMQRGVAEKGLTTARAGALWALFHGGPMTQRALATQLGVTPRNVTGLLDALQEDGLVVREAHPTDRRATLVSLTEKGGSVTSALRDGRDELAALLFADVPADRLDTFTATLAQVTERLRTVGTDGPK